MNKNKEAKSSAPAWSSRILLRKTRRLNPLLLLGAVAFCFAKQGGFYDF